jgi:tetratricopeptide (TPR) repeat protein
MRLRLLILAFAMAAPLAGAPPLRDAGAAADKALLKLQEATAAMLRGRYDQAVALYDDVLKDETLPKTRQASILSDRGVAKWRQQQPDAALADFGKAIAASPDYAQAYNNRGSVLMEQDRIEDAFKDFDKALSLSPNFAAAYNNRGNANNLLKHYEAAEADFRKAVELMPGSAVPYNGRGKTQAVLARPYTALRYLNRAVALNGQYIAAYENRALVYAHLERYDDAAQDYDRVIEARPNDAVLYVKRGYANAKLNRSPQAWRDFAKALEIDPDNADALVGRAAQNIDRKRYDAALEDLTQAMAIDAAIPESFYYQARAHQETGDIDSARKEVTKAIELDPSYAEAYLLRGKLTENSADASTAASAIADYRQALLLNPFSVETRSAFEKVSGETAGSVVAPVAEPVDGWSIYAPAKGRFVAVNERYAKLHVLLEMHGDGQAAILEWTPLKDTLDGIGLLRYSAGKGQAGSYEYVAIIDLYANKVMAIEPYLWGEQKAKWDWTQYAVTVTDPEGVAAYYELRKPRPAPAQPRVVSDDNPWDIFGGGRRETRGRHHGPSLFDWLFQ